MYLKLSHLDSNQDKQYQKLSYYPYTIGQSRLETLCFILTMQIYGAFLFLQNFFYEFLYRV